jgi:hypothetical protein
METKPANAVYRSAPQRARLVREFVFDRLPLAVRDRLERGIAHGAPPDPLVAAPSGAALLALRGALVTAIGAVLAGLTVWFWDLGSLHAKNATQPPAYAGIYGGIAFVAVLAGGVFLDVRRRQRGAPFRAGRYLFALDLVEVSGGRLRVTSLDTLRRVEARPRGVALVFDEGPEVPFPLPKHEDPAAVAARLTTEIERARELVYPADGPRLERIDPFHEVRISDDWAASADTQGAPRSKLATVALVAVAAAAPAGFGLRELHERTSDDLMFERAAAQLPGYIRRPGLLRYLERGHRHEEEAARLLVEDAADDRGQLVRYFAKGGRLGELADDALLELSKGEPEALVRYLQRKGPRSAEVDEALFEYAKRTNTPAAYTTYLEAGTRHADEVRRELRPEADWQQASRSPLVGSLCSYVRRNPGSKHEDEAWKRIHQAFDEALPAFRAAEKPPAEGLRFAEALLAYLHERADPRVDLQVRTVPSSSVADADALLGAKYGDRYLPSASHFRARALEGLARDVRAAIASWFGAAFPRGVAEIARPDGEEGRPTFDVTLEPVAYGSVGWKSPLSTSDEPAHVTPLVGFLVEVRGRIPGRDGKPDTVLTWKVRVEDTTNAKILTRDTQGKQRDLLSMIEDAFAKFFDGVPARVSQSFHEHL